MTAFLPDFIHVFNTERFDSPLPGRVGLTGHELHFFGVIETLTFTDDVFREKLR